MDMTFEERQVKILELCKEPKSSEEIKHYFGISHQATLNSLRKLRETGHIIKLNPYNKPNGHDVVFKSTGKRLAELKPRGKVKAYTTGVTICGVKF